MEGKQKLSLQGTYEGLNPDKGNNLVLLQLHLNIQSNSDPLLHLSYDCEL